MTAVLKVKDAGSWRTIVEPYIKVDETWKTVHNIWIKHGDSLRFAHKTAISRYNSTLVVDNVSEGDGNAGSYTVPPGVRYLRVSITGGGGQGAGGIRTDGSYILSEAHYQCSGSVLNTSTVTDRAYGGPGGHRGHLDLKFEVIPGETYTWYGGSPGSGNGTNGTPWYLHYSTYNGTQAGVGDFRDGVGGGQGSRFYFSGPSATFSAAGGLGGSTGIVTVVSNCLTPGAVYDVLGYNVSVTSPSRPGQVGSNLISATNLVETTTNVATDGGGAGSGHVEAGGASGTAGSTGTLSIWKYGKN